MNDMEQAKARTCPICNLPVSSTGTSGDWFSFNCQRCGDYRLTGTALTVIEQTLRNDRTSPLAKPALSHFVRRLDRSVYTHPMVREDLASNIIKQPQLPMVREQIANLLIWLGENSLAPGTIADIHPDTHLAIVGAADPRGLQLLLEHLIESGLAKGSLVNAPSERGRGKMILSVEGWDEFDRLKRQQPTSRRAFIAMQYGDAELDEIVNKHFRSAVEKTGFTLRRLDDENPAGLIDDRLRVEIRQSRFVIADLTHGNNGAYWEAGFAEGLGKPVIYTCRADRFEKERTHFDTNHHLTVIWDHSDPASAVRLLTATIRATLPEDAKMED